MDIQFVTSPAPANLRHVVREFWRLDDDGAPHAGLPKPYVELVVSLDGRHLWRATPEREEHLYELGWVTPVQDGPRYARSEGPRRLIGARLNPRVARALFAPLPPGDGRPPPRLETLIGNEARTLRDRLLAAQDTTAQFSLFAEWLAARAPAHPGALWPAPSPDQRAVAIASDLGLSPRSLRRTFASEIGASPKQLLQLQRLEAVLQDPELLDPAVPIASLAAKHGFADQAHMTRQIARMTGHTPGALRRRKPDGPPHMVEPMADLFNPAETSGPSLP